MFEYFKIKLKEVRKYTPINVEKNKFLKTIN